jgi:hypothetical protein
MYSSEAILTDVLACLNYDGVRSTKIMYVAFVLQIKSQNNCCGFRPLRRLAYRGTSKLRSHQNLIFMESVAHAAVLAWKVKRSHESLYFFKTLIALHAAFS